jgi:hypothetical protein
MCTARINVKLIMLLLWDYYLLLGGSQSQKLQTLCLESSPIVGDLVKEPKQQEHCSRSGLVVTRG